MRHTHTHTHSGYSAFSASPEVVLTNSYHGYHGNKLHLFSCYQRIKDIKVAAGYIPKPIYT